MPRIYFAELLSSPGQFALPDKRAQHVRVLRLQSGDEISLFDGQGHVALAKIVSMDKKGATVERGVVNISALSHMPPVHLAMSLIRAEAMDWAIQKAVELGVTTITPVITTRTQGRFTVEQAEKKHMHWQEVMISACEQSGLNRLPCLEPLTLLEKILHAPQTGARIIFKHNAPRLTMLSEKHGGETTLLIGPEGGFTETEVSDAHEAGFLSFALHENILRAETAAVVAMSLVQFHLANK